jgi:bifunctional non-homologous end joining protein LigD
VTLQFSPVVPFEPISTEHFPAGEDWVSQVKWDGVRILVYYDGDSVRVFNRRRNERTMQYPELLNIAEYCTADSVILDGEVIALEDGKPSFQHVMKRDGIRKASSVRLAKNQVSITYMIFDILYCNGKWVTGQTLHERQQLLRSVITEKNNIQLVQNHDDHQALYAAVTEHGLEGVVIKKLTSSYMMNGKDQRWIKKKVYKDLVAVVGGVTQRLGVVNALLLGLYDEQGQLWYIGHAGTGKFTQQEWRTITQTVQNIAIGERPFINVPERSQGAIWVRPMLSVKIKFMNWTRNNTLRQPSIQSLVNVDPTQCTFDQS